MMAGLERRHVAGWYSVAIAVEVMNLACTGIFLDVLFPVLGQEVGHWAPDYNVPCTSPTPVDGAACKAHILGRWVDINAYYLYIRSAIVVFQGLAVIPFGPMADHKQRRLYLLASSAALSLASGAFFFFIPSSPTPNALLVAGGLTILQGTGFTLTQTFLNACLRDVAPEVEVNDETAPLLPPADADGDTTPPVPYGLITSRISARGSSSGAAVGVAIVIVATTLIDKADNTTFSIQASLAGTSLLLALLTGVGISAMRGLGLDGSNLSSGPTSQARSSHLWMSVGSVLRPRNIRQLPDIFRFLVSWMIVGDFLHILPSTFMVFIISKLGASPSEAVSTTILILLIGVVFVFCLPPVQRQFQISNKAVIVWSVALAAIPGLWGSVPLWTGGRGGFKTLSGAMVFRCILGIAYPTFFSWARAFFATIIPQGHESTFFSVFSLSDRGSSFFGPLIIGTITQVTGGFDWVWAFSALVFILPLGLLLCVDPERAFEDARAWKRAQEATGDVERST